MAIDRHGAGLVLLRIAVGVFFLFAGLGRVRWLWEPSALGVQLAAWQTGVKAGSISAQYLQKIAIPHTSFFARAVPVGELCSGVALILGFWTPLFALVAFATVLNVHIASGSLFQYAFLTNGYGLPVLGATLALAVGGVRLPLSVRRN